MVAECIAERSKLVAPTDFYSDVCAGAGGEAHIQDAAVAMVDDTNDKTTENGGETRFGGVSLKAVDGPCAFGKRRVGVVKRPFIGGGGSGWRWWCSYVWCAGAEGEGGGGGGGGHHLLPI